MFTYFGSLHETRSQCKRSFVIVTFPCQRVQPYRRTLQNYDGEQAMPLETMQQHWGPWIWLSSRPFRNVFECLWYVVPRAPEKLRANNASGLRIFHKWGTAHLGAHAACDPMHHQHYKQVQNQGGITFHNKEAVCGRQMVAKWCKAHAVCSEHPEGLRTTTTLAEIVTNHNNIWYDIIIIFECLPLGGPCWVLK